MIKENFKKEKLKTLEILYIFRLLETLETLEVLKLLNVQKFQGFASNSILFQNWLEEKNRRKQNSRITRKFSRSKIFSMMKLIT